MPATILVIEDNPESLRLLAYLLSCAGHETLTAADGEEGLRLALGSRPDLVLCDIQLPGIDGYEIARRLKASDEHAGIPLVAVTAYSMPGDRESAMAADFDGYLTKPIDPATILGLVDAFLPATKRGEAR